MGGKNDRGLPDIQAHPEPGQPIQPFQSVGPWTLIDKRPSGHKMFRHNDGRVAIADASGLTPEDTDDGVLWIDRSAPLRGVLGSAATATMPLVKPDGTTTVTPITLASALHYAGMFEWPIEIGQESYLVRMSRSDERLRYGEPVVSVRTLRALLEEASDEGSDDAGLAIRLRGLLARVTAGQ